MLAPQEERLGEQHPRHRDGRERQQYELHRRLPAEEVRLGEYPAGLHEEGDQHRDERRRRQTLVHPVDRPLEEDGEHEVAEDGEHEDGLRHELAPDVECGAEVQRVDQREDKAEEHLQHAEDDGELHLVRVAEGELVGGVVPAGVEPEGVHRVRRGARLLPRALCPQPGRTEKVRHQSEDVVVQEPRVHREEAHQQQHVPAMPRIRQDLVHRVHRLKLALVGDEVEREERHEGAVADVAEHDPEEEGERDDRESRRIDLAIPGHAVRLDESMEALRKLVELEVGGRLLVSVDQVHDGRHLGTRARSTPPQRRRRLVDERHRTPRLGDEHLARQVVVPHVEHQVHRALLGDALLPRR
mmetsp:Transcript_10136/g.23433  ORF Transcript_10136/g.23433 Transcript_10136/m.23433 type:complete len:356 (-) Transcript_10136:1503-2570(-)